MSITVPGSVTGAAINGLTTPSFTVTADYADARVKQSYVSALGGTQTGVVAHSADVPFVMKITKPSTLRTLGIPNPLTGIVSNIPKNTYGLNFIKGVNVNATNKAISQLRLVWDVPAGSVSQDLNSLKSMLSFAAGAIYTLADQLDDAVANNSI